jgi:hypothetical protein
MAAGVSIVVKGVREFDDAMERLIKNAEFKAREIVVEGGAIIAKNAKSEFSTAVVDTKTGSTRVLASGGKRLKGERILKKGNHVSGSKPHNRTGALARSVRMVKVEELSFGRWMSQTGPTLVYSRRVELGFTGTDSLGRQYAQPPFPYMQPGFEKSAGELRELYVRKWREGLT